MTSVSEDNDKDDDKNKDKNKDKEFDFNIEFTHTIQKDVLEYLSRNNHGNVEIDIPTIIYRIIESIKSNPKFKSTNQDSQGIHKQILNIVIKYIDTLIYKEQPPPCSSINPIKHLILDSLQKDYKHSNNDSIRFKFQDTMVISNLNIDHVTFQTKMTFNEPHVFLFIKQFPTTNFRTTKGNIGCYAVLSLDKIVHTQTGSHRDDLYTYYYKNQEPHVYKNPISKSLDEMTISFSPNPIINPIDINSIDHNEILCNDDVNSLKSFQIGETIRLISKNEDSADYHLAVIEQINHDETTILTESSVDTTNEGYKAIESHLEKTVIYMKYS